MNCLNKDCGEEVPSFARRCVVCGFDCGFPNVRHAEKKEETDALDHRVNDILSKENEDAVIQFGEAVKKSEVDIQAILPNSFKAIDAYSL